MTVLASLAFCYNVGPCLLGKKIVYLKKNVHCNQPFLSVKHLKRGANSVAPDHEAASNLPLIAFTNLHHHHQCENAQISCTITTMTLLLLHRSDSRANQEWESSSDLPSIFKG